MFKDTDETVFIGKNPDESLYAVWTVRQEDDEHHQGQEECLKDDPRVVSFFAAMKDQIANAKTPIDSLLAKLQEKAIFTAEEVQAISVSPNPIKAEPQ